MEKFSKKRLLAYLRYQVSNCKKALKDPDKEARHDSIFWTLMQTEVLINDIETWEITELNYGKEIDKFI